MGQRLSAWRQSDAADYAAFLVRLFGEPTFGSNKPGGAVVWDSVTLAKSKLFGKPVSFQKVMVKDEHVYQDMPKPHWTYLYLSVSVPANAVQEADVSALHRLYSGLGYDYQRGILWVRTNNLERGITILLMATDVLLRKLTVPQLLTSNAMLTALNALYSDPSKTMKVAASRYMSLCSNLLALSKLSIAVGQPTRAAVGAADPNLANFGSVAGVERFDDPYVGYTSNYPDFLAFEQERDDQFYSVPRPYLGGANRAPNPAYASQVPNYDSIEHLAIHPKCKGECAHRVVQQFQKDKQAAAKREAMMSASHMDTPAWRMLEQPKKGASMKLKRAERMSVRPDGQFDGRNTYNVLAVPASAGVSKFNEHMDVKPSGKYEGRNTYNVLAVPASAGVSKFNEHLTSEPDPRFLVGAGDLYYNVGSDINEITRTYGTVDQRITYPKYTDAVVYGITSVPTEPTNYLERRRLAKPKLSTNFKPVKSEHFVSTGAEHVKYGLAEEGAGPDPFLYWTEGK